MFLTESKFVVDYYYFMYGWEEVAAMFSLICI